MTLASPGRRPVVRLLDVTTTSETASFAFEVSEDLTPLFWPTRELNLYCSEGIDANPQRLGAAFAYAMAPVGWTQGADVVFPASLEPDEEALGTLSDLGSFLAEQYGWSRHDPFAALFPSSAKHGGREDEPSGAGRGSAPAPHVGLMFSGGVDSAWALADFNREIDWLITLSNFENLDSRTPEAQVAVGLDTAHAVAEAWGLGWIHLRTNIAAVFKHNRFDDRFPPECSFWLGLEHVQHIATAVVVTRPRLREVLMAGGFDELHRRVGSCAASSTFIEKYRWRPSLRLVHEHDRRQEKIERLVDHAPALLRTLRTCYSSGAGTCDLCRKCQATALMVVAGGGSLAQTSFPCAMARRLLARIAEIRDVDESEHRFFNQALAGRRLSGTRAQRWDQLAELLGSQ